MAGLLQRLSRLARPAPRAASATTPPAATSGPAPQPRPSTDAAWRMLELEPGASLDDVRAAYRRLAQHYHPRTREVTSAPAARVVIARLTDALEVLEEHLLPWRPPRRDAAP
jgi:DnaJ-domain-containing protein 1